MANGEADGTAAALPRAMGRATRGVELASPDDLDEARFATCMPQVAAVPGVGKRSPAVRP